MALPWKTIETVSTDEGELQLRQRGKDLLITIAGRPLMHSQNNRSEIALAERACDRIRSPKPRVLFGGFGLGFTLRAGLDRLPDNAEVVVVEINPVVVKWGRGPVGVLTHNSIDDPRVEVVVDDVAKVIQRAAQKPAGKKYDAIIIDLYLGPNEGMQSREDPFYGPRAVADIKKALRPGGVYAVWSEEPDAAFERRLKVAGFSVEKERFGRRGRGYVVYLCGA